MNETAVDKNGKPLGYDPSRVIFTESCYSVEKGIPLPTAAERPRHNRVIFPFKKMEVTDSFSFNKDQKLKVREAQKRWTKDHPEQSFCVRKKMNGNYRCWRIT